MDRPPQATPKGSWPFCPAHPEVPMFWHPAGWGWGCVVERSRDQAAPQPYVLEAGKSARVDPRGLTPPDDDRATPARQAWAEAKWASQTLGFHSSKAQKGVPVKGRKASRPRR